LGWKWIKIIRAFASATSSGSIGFASSAAKTSVRAVLWRKRRKGPRTFRALINHYGGARSALAALPSLARRGGAEAAMKICSQAEAEREMEAANKLGVDFVALGEAACLVPHQYRPTT
jgi:hypothetical protein